ncbi:MAG: Glyoxalase family protein [Bryobacterales bacterium]|nr:Glyoxalase family protein [Bryobacterales bacterium]
MIENRSAPGGTIVPSLIYSNVATAIDWLCDVFGFKERLRAGGDDGKVGHAQLAIGEGGVMLGAARTGQGFDAPDSAEFRPPNRNEVNQTLLVRVEDVDGHYEHAKQRGARILQPPATHPYGERQYTAEDLEGHRWTFSQSVADVKPEEWGATVSEIKSRAALLPRPRLCYLEIPAIDLGRSVDFYEKVLGWNIRHRDTTRPSFDDATRQVSGAWVTGRDISREPGLLPYIWVDSIDDVLAQVAAHGGEIVESTRLDSPGGEWIATIRDPAGNMIGLYQEGAR